jgi:hypothetical protein
VVGSLTAPTTMVGSREPPSKNAGAHYRTSSGAWAGLGRTTEGAFGRTIRYEGESTHLPTPAGTIPAVYRTASSSSSSRTGVTAIVVVVLVTVRVSVRADPRVTPRHGPPSPS